MKFLKFLGDIKGKVLDAAHYEKLKHAYELQEKNIEQLNRNNELLQLKLQKLETENEKLRIGNKEYETRLKTYETKASEQSLSKVALQVLNVFRQSDEIRLSFNQIRANISHKDIQIRAAIDELVETGYLSHWSADIYSLSKMGRKVIARFTDILNGKKDG